MLAFLILGTSGRPDSWRTILGSREVASVEENLSWSRSKGMMSSTMYDRSISIFTRWQAKVFFFCFLSLSHEAFVLFLFPPESDVLIQRAKTQQHCCSRSEDELTLSLPSLSGFSQRSRFTIAWPADEHAPPRKLCSSLNFSWLWKHRSHNFRMGKKTQIEHHCPPSHYWLRQKGKEDWKNERRTKRVL